MPDVDLDAKVYDGSVDCGKYRFVVQGQYLDGNSKTLELMIPLEKVVAGGDQEATCKGLIEKDGKQKKSSASYTFTRPQTMQLDGCDYHAQLPSGACLQTYQ